MRNLILVVVMLCVVALPLQAAEECAYDFMTCGARWAENLRNATCTFLDSPQRYFTWYINLGAGTQLEVVIDSDDFGPLVLLYRGDDVDPLISASGSHTARLTYNVRHSDTYWIVVTAKDESVRSGMFDMAINCTTDCQQPVISTPPQSLRAAYGSQVRINIEADGTPPLKFKWFDEAAPSVILADTYKTFISPPMTKDTTFGVRAFNDCGAVVQTAATVTVEPCSMPAIATQPVNAVVSAGGTATFTVAATGTPDLWIRWYEGAKGDTSAYRASGETLTVPNATKSATYWARVTNACGEAQSDAVTLTIGTLRKRAVRH